MPAFGTLGEVNRYTKSSKHGLCCIRAALTDCPCTHLAQCVSPPLALALLKPARKVLWVAASSDRSAQIPLRVLDF